MLRAFDDLSTPLVADACVRTGVPVRAAPSGIGSVVAATGSPAARYGRARDAAHQRGTCGP